MFGGSAGRVFTSVQETGDMLLVAIYVLATSCNAILLSQILYYWPRASGPDAAAKTPAGDARASADAAIAAKRKPVKRD